MQPISVVANAIILLACSGLTSAMPWSVPQEHFEVLSLRHETPLNPAAVTDVRCWDTEAHIVFHDQNAAQLSICGGELSGRGNNKCRTRAPTTVGRRGSAQFSLEAVNGGTAITLTKRRWEECVRAARDKCPTGSLSGTCLGGASGGDVFFTLETTMRSVE